MNLFLPMTYKQQLIQAQIRCSKHLAFLVNYAGTEDFQMVFREVWRSPETQAIYVEQKKSKTKNSKHLDGLAADFQIYMRGQWTPLFNGKTGEALKKDIQTATLLGNYWKSLHPNNDWGGFWGWDPWHFQTSV